MKRSARPATERRDRSVEVIDAAIEVFYRKGYADASMQDVADVVGVLKGSLYHYIDSKEELLYSILSESHAQAVAIMDEVAGQDGSAFGRLRHYLEEMASWYLEHIERVSIYFNEGRHLTGERSERVRAQRRDSDRFLRAMLQEARADGDVRADLDPRLGSLMIFGTMNSFPGWYRRDGAHTVAEIVRAFTDWTLAAVAAEDGVAPRGTAPVKDAMPARARRAAS